jgi:flagellar assembly factor FliW
MRHNPQNQPPEPALVSLETRNFGTLAVRPEQIIIFSPGLLGFTAYSRYVLIERPQDAPFFWLQCVERPDLAFVVVDPLPFFPGYRPAARPQVLREVGAQSADEVQVLVIVTIPPGRPQDMTANLMGPLIINFRNRRGRQAILEDPRWSHQQRLLPAESPGP